LKANRRLATNEFGGVDGCELFMYGALMSTAAHHPRPSRARARRPIQLAALRGFEVAARHLSFTLAAEELALTQSAISRQIATLERQVGKALFVRKTRALALTAHGERLHAAVRQALAGIDTCVDTIRGVGQAPRIGLTTYASFASLWLVPRLAEFQQHHPDIEFRIDASDRAIDLAEEGLDLAIRRSLPSRIDASHRPTPLCEEFVAPALSPHLLERSGLSLREPADLQRLPLIEMDDHARSGAATSWQRWFESFGVPAPRVAGGKLTFSFVDQAVQAAVRGQGVVLGRTPLLADTVAAGQLLVPFPDMALRTGYHYYLLLHPERAQAPEIVAFTRWLIDEFARGPRGQT
jgi:LysR family transcriptional regulator, glycine cleavage system transcriptional activator